MIYTSDFEAKRGPGEFISRECEKPHVWRIKYDRKDVPRLTMKCKACGLTVNARIDQLWDGGLKWYQT